MLRSALWDWIAFKKLNKLLLGCVYQRHCFFLLLILLYVTYYECSISVHNFLLAICNRKKWILFLVSLRRHSEFHYWNAWNIAKFGNHPNNLLLEIFFTPYHIIGDIAHETSQPLIQSEWNVLLDQNPSFKRKWAQFVTNPMLLLMFFHWCQIFELFKYCGNNFLPDSCTKVAIQGFLLLRELRAL